MLAISTNERKEDHSETFVIMVFDRVSDIWRGYWAQRLLWEVGAHVAFGPPSLKQVRCRVLLGYDIDKSYSSKEIPLIGIDCVLLIRTVSCKAFGISTKCLNDYI